MSGVLDVEDPISSEYTWRCPRPGSIGCCSARALFPVRGEMIDVRLRLPVEGRRRYKGILLAANNETVVVVVDDQEFELPLRSVDRARVFPAGDRSGQVVRGITPQESSRLAAFHQSESETMNKEILMVAEAVSTEKVSQRTLFSKRSSWPWPLPPRNATTKRPIFRSRLTENPATT